MSRFIEEGFIPLEVVEKPFEPPAWVGELKAAGYVPQRLGLPEPTSYCAGVVRGIDSTNLFIRDVKALGRVPYLYHAPIHSESKLREWEEEGAVLVDDIDEVPDGGDVDFSAHGVGENIWEVARRKQLKGIDATCPLVEKTHREIAREAQNGAVVVLVGKEGHDEIEGSRNIVPEMTRILPLNATEDQIIKFFSNLEGVDVAISLQTTLAVKETKKTIDKIVAIRPDAHFPRVSDICYATQHRQDGLDKAIDLTKPDLAVVFGSNEKSHTPSSNSIRLRELASSRKVNAVLVENVHELDASLFEGVNSIVVTAGASAAPERIKEFVLCMKELGMTDDQIKRVVVAEESQQFAPARRFDFSIV